MRAPFFGFLELGAAVVVNNLRFLHAFYHVFVGAYFEVEQVGILRSQLDEVVLEQDILFRLVRRCYFVGKSGLGLLLVLGPDFFPEGFLGALEELAGERLTFLGFDVPGGREYVLVLPDVISAEYFLLLVLGPP